MRALTFAALVLLALCVCFGMLWGSLALWFRLPVTDVIKYLAIGVFLIPGFTTIRALFGKRNLQSPSIFAVFLVALLVWWQTLQPPADGDWEPEVSVQTTGSIDGDILTLENVRAFERRSEDDVQEIWTSRTYDLSKLETTDLFLSYWGDPKIAHFVLSFGFSNGDYLA